MVTLPGGVLKFYSFIGRHIWLDHHLHWLCLKRLYILAPEPVIWIMLVFKINCLSYIFFLLEKNQLRKSCAINIYILWRTQNCLKPVDEMICWVVYFWRCVCALLPGHYWHKLAAVFSPYRACSWVKIPILSSCTPWQAYACPAPKTIFTVLLYLPGILNVSFSQHIGQTTVRDGKPTRAAPTAIAKRKDLARKVSMKFLCLHGCIDHHASLVSKSCLVLYLKTFHPFHRWWSI
jgi:hypothetical protein